MIKTEFMLIQMEFSYLFRQTTTIFEHLGRGKWACVGEIVHIFFNLGLKATMKNYSINHVAGTGCHYIPVS